MAEEKPAAPMGFERFSDGVYQVGIQLTRYDRRTYRRGRTSMNGYGGTLLLGAANVQGAWVFIELGAAVIGLAVLARLAHRLGFSASWALKGPT